MSKAVNVDYSSSFDVFYDFFYRVTQSQMTIQQSIQIMGHTVFNV